MPLITERDNIMTLRLKTTCAPNPRIQPLADGEIKVEGIEFDWDLKPVPMLFRNNIAFDDPELSEMSISETMLTIDRKEAVGKGRWDWWALPIFLARGHFWGGMLVGNASGIKDLSDLKGKQVGVPDYCMTAALWLRITLKDLYGIETKDNVWHNLRPKEESQAIALELDKDPPPGVTVHWEIHDDPIAMLERGELDAAIGVRLPGESTKVRKLFDDDGAAIIGEYYKQTGCFHANHQFIVQRRLLENEPGAAMKLYSAFRESKQVALQKDRKTAGLYFPSNTLEAEAAVYGEDPFPMGLKAMRKTVQRAMQGSLEQGLIRKPINIDEMYHPDTRGT
jgi:4,5-dihydroxyphthalate decarboxylase